MTGKEIVDIIEATLQAKGISKGELYEACGISSAQMSNWRRGKNFPLMDTIARINKFLGIDLLITNDDAPRSGLRIRPLPPADPTQPGLRIPGNKKSPVPSEDEAKEQELNRLFSLADPWLQDRVLDLLRSAESAKQAQGGGK